MQDAIPGLQQLHMHWLLLMDSIFKKSFMTFTAIFCILAIYEMHLKPLQYVKCQLKWATLPQKKQKKTGKRAVKESSNKEHLKGCCGEYSKILISHILAYAKYTKIISIFMNIQVPFCKKLNFSIKLRSNRFDFHKWIAWCAWFNAKFSRTH